MPAAGPCCPVAARSAHPALQWGLGVAASPRAPRRQAAGGTPSEHVGTAAPLVQAACFPHPHSLLPSPISQKGSLMAVTWRGLSAPCSCQPCLPEPRSCLCVTVSSDVPTGTGPPGGQHPTANGSPPPPAVCPAPLPLTLKVPTPLPRTPCLVTSSGPSSTSSKPTVRAVSPGSPSQPYLWFQPSSPQTVTTSCLSHSGSSRRAPN